MNNDKSFLLGIIMGVVSCIMILVFTEPKWVQQAYEDKKRCEEVIPRNETCVMIALPRSKE